MSDNKDNQMKVEEEKDNTTDESDESIYSLDATLSQFIELEDTSGYQVYPGAERLQYDFTAERNYVNCTNLIESTAHLIKGCLGAGVLSMHVGYMYGGLWTALAVNVTTGIIVAHCMLMLVKSAQKMYLRLRIPKLTYAQLAEVSFATGPWRNERRFSKLFRYTVELCLFIEMCGTCCVYEIMIAKTLKQALESVSSSIETENLNLRLYILMTAVPLILLCLIRSLKYLAPFSLAADILIGLCVIIAVYYSLVSPGHIMDRTAWKSFKGLIRCHGICLFATDGVALALPVENNMKKPKYFHIVIQYGMTVVIACLAITGFVGYWGWGEDSRSPITIHMPKEAFPLMLQFIMVLMMSITFAVNLWVPFKIFWYYFGKKYKRKRGVWERFYKIVHVSLITCLSVAFPNLIGLVVFLGNSFITFVSLVFPALIDSMIIWKEPWKWKVRFMLLKNILLILIGIFMCGSSFFTLDY